MTHIYSRGCFKLIFRKCLPIHTFYPPQAASTRRHTYTYVLYRDCPPSRAFASSRTILQHLCHSSSFVSSQCFPNSYSLFFSSFSPLFLASLFILLFLALEFFFSLFSFSFYSLLFFVFLFLSTSLL